MISQTDDLDFIARFSAATCLITSRLPLTDEDYELVKGVAEDEAALERLRRDLDSYRTMRKAMDYDTLRHRANQLGIDGFAAVRGYLALSYQKISIDRVLDALDRTVKRGTPSDK